MKAHVISQVNDLGLVDSPLTLRDIPVPVPGESEILLRISCCGICHTEIDEIEGRSPPAFYPIVPGHQVVGFVESRGSHASRFEIGARLGVGWIFSACGNCSYCLAGFENLCPYFKGCGRDANGGFAEYMLVNEKFATPIPPALDDAEAAPLLCGGAIGYRALRLSGIRNGDHLGLSGFGSSGHLVLKMVRQLYPETKVAVFARNIEERKFATSLGASWTGDFSMTPHFDLKAIIDTTPVWRPLLESLRHLAPGGRLVINAIRKEDSDKAVLLDLEYHRHLWMEKEIKSVANISRKDIAEFLELAGAQNLKPDIEMYAFENANKALSDLKQKPVRGAKVLKVSLK